TPHARPWRDPGPSARPDAHRTAVGSPPQAGILARADARRGPGPGEGGDAGSPPPPRPSIGSPAMPEATSRTAHVVGLGLVGASIASGLRSRGWYVTGEDLDERRAVRARELGAIDAAGTGQGAEIAFVATPASSVVPVANHLFDSAAAASARL